MLNPFLVFDMALLMPLLVKVPNRLERPPWPVSCVELTSSSVFFDSVVPSYVEMI